MAANSQPPLPKGISKAGREPFFDAPAILNFEN
jgi:hypothetical protein